MKPWFFLLASVAFGGAAGAGWADNPSMGPYDAPAASKAAAPASVDLTTTTSDDVAAAVGEQAAPAADTASADTGVDSKAANAEQAAAEQKAEDEKKAMIPHYDVDYASAAPVSKATSMDFAAADAKMGVYDGGKLGDGLRASFLDLAVNKYGKTPEAAAAIAGNVGTESNMFKTNNWVFNEDSKQYELANPVNSKTGVMVKYGAMAEGDYKLPKLQQQPTSFGIMQAHLDRAEGLQDFVNAQRYQRAWDNLTPAQQQDMVKAGVTPQYQHADLSADGLKGSLNDQIGYLFKQDLPNEASHYNKLNTLDNPDSSLYDKTEAMTQYYERPAKPTKAETRIAIKAGYTDGVPFKRMGGQSRWENAEKFYDFAQNHPAATAPAKTWMADLKSSGQDNFGGDQNLVISSLGE